MTQDEEHLRLLSIFHYVVAGMAGLFSLFPIMHLAIGLMVVFIHAKSTGGEDLPPEWFGWVFVIMAAVFIAIGLIFACFVFAAGRALARRKHYLFCLVMGGVDCLFMPFGTALGIFTIIVLTRESVKKLFLEKSDFDSNI